LSAGDSTSDDWPRSAAPIPVLPAMDGRHGLEDLGFPYGKPHPAVEQPGKGFLLPTGTSDDGVELREGGAGGIRA
jgi:hypothetical protein